MLVDVLKEQYSGVSGTNQVQANLDALLLPNTFTVTTAHQPNLFTGPLYFLYKILHVIKLAEWLNTEFVDNKFVPVFYMGSEDADFEELNNFTISGKRYAWATNQHGAVGKMQVDDELVRIIRDVHQQIGVEAYGDEIIQLLSCCFVKGKSIQQSTLELVNALFGKYGLVVLIADHAELKRQMANVFWDDLTMHKPNDVVKATIDRLQTHYNVQANPRPVNLFYLEGHTRERIEVDGEGFKVVNTDIRFTNAAMQELVKEHPERLSPNVILRGLFQETILPNILFVGGGGELAYWLQLAELFDHYRVPYPVLVLRNSFLIAETKWQTKAEKLGLQLTDLFLSEGELLEQLIQKSSQHELKLNGHYAEAEALFQNIEAKAAAVDPSLQQHVQSIRTRSIKYLHALEKKMLRAEKRKYSDQHRSIQHLKQSLFPENGLQERVENFIGFYAKWGQAFIDELHRHSLALDQQFTILSQQD